MSKQVSSLSVLLSGGIAPFSNAMRAAIKPVQGFMGTIASAGTKLLAFSGIGAAVAAGWAAISHIGDGFKLDASLERTRTQFAAFIGDNKKAADAVADLTNFAKRTPFELPNLLTAGRELLSFGVSNEKLLPSLQAIGDVAAGIGAPVEEIAETFGRVAQSGKLTDRELRELSHAGIPIVGELAKVFHTTQQQVEEMASKGTISFSALQQAFANLSGPGGRFAGQMEKQAGTLGGLWTRLSGAVTEALGGITQSLIDGLNLKGGIAALSSGITTAGNVIKGWIGTVVPIFIRIGTAAYQGFSTLYSAVAPVVSAVSNFISRAWTATVPVVVGAARTIWAEVVSAWNAIYAFVAPIVQAIYQVIVNNWQNTLVSTIALALSIWDVVSSVWGVIVQLAQAIWSGIVTVWQWGAELITGHTTTAAATVSGAFQGIVSASNWLRDAVTLVFNALGYVISHWKEGIEIVGLEVILAFVRIGNQAQYIFGTVIPAIAVWFANNWKDIFRDMWNVTVTIFSNLASNIVNIIKNIPKLIKGQVSFGELWTPLTDGFKSSLKELPDIPAREMGALEKALDTQVSDLEAKYGQGLGDHLAEKQQQAKDVAKKVTDTFKDLTIQPPKIEKPKIPAPDAPKIIPQLTPDNLSLTITPEIKHAKALRVGSAEAQLARYAEPRLLSGLPGQLAKPQDARIPTAPPAVAPPAWKPDQKPDATAKDQLTVEKDSNWYIRGIYNQSTNIQPAVFS